MRDMNQSCNRNLQAAESQIEKYTRFFSYIAFVKA